MPLDANLADSHFVDSRSTESNAWSQFTSSLLYEGQQQVKALAQLGGSDVHFVDKPDEAKSSLGEHAQLFGRAVADAVPIVITAAVARYGLGRYAAREAEASSFWLRRSAVGLNAVEAGTTGFTTGALLKPSDDNTANNFGSLVLDRTKNGIAGAVSFSLLTGVNASIAAGGARLGSEFGRRLLANPLANGALSGLPGGLINAEIDSVAAGNGLTFDGMKIERSIYEMSLVGGVFGAVSSLARRSAAQPITPEERSADSIAQPEQTPLLYQRAPSPNAQELSSSVAMNVAAPLGQSFAEAAKLPAESSLTSAPLTQSPFGGLFGDERALNLVQGARLPARRFLSMEKDPKITDATPQEDWNNRADLLSQTIARRINSLQLSQVEFDKVRQSYPQADRPIVDRLLDIAAANSTDYAVKRSLVSVGKQLQEKFDQSLTFFDFLAGDASSSGNALAYLLRKSVEQGPTTRYIDGARDLLEGDRAIAIFDDISKMPSAQLQHIGDMLDKNDLAVVDMNAFDRLPNFVDFAIGPKAVTDKLDLLVQKVKEIQQAEPTLDVETAVDRSLKQDLDKTVALLNSYSSGLSPYTISVVRPEPVAIEDAFKDQVEPEQVRKFLEARFKDSSGKTDRRIFAAEILAEDVDYHSLVSMTSRLKGLADAVEESARATGRDPARDLFVVAMDGEGSSDAFVTHLYTRVNDIARERVLTKAQLKESEKNGTLNDARAVLLDDTFYTGGQATAHLGALDPKMPAAVAALTAYERFARRAPQIFSPNQQLVTTQTELSLHLYKGTLARMFSESDREQAFALNGTSNGLREMSTTKVYPHMTSDTTPVWLARFAHKFMKVSNPELPSVWPELDYLPKSSQSRLLAEQAERKQAEKDSSVDELSLLYAQAHIDALLGVKAHALDTIDPFEEPFSAAIVPPEKAPRKQRRAALAVVGASGGS